MHHKLDEQALATYARYFAPGAQALEPSAQAFCARLRGNQTVEWRVSYPPPIFRAGLLSLIGARSAALAHLVFSLPERLFGGDYRRMLTAQHLPEARIDEILRCCTPQLLARARLFARPDAILTDAGFKLVEMNVTPSLGGLGICNHYVEAFQQDPLYPQLMRDGITLPPADLDQRWARLMRAQRARPHAERPLLLELLVDPDEVAEENFARPDFHAMAHRAGFDVLTARPGGLDFRPDGVYCDARRIDVVYTDFVLAEQLQHALAPDLTQRLCEAEAAGLIVLISAPPACAVFDNKVNLALLCDERYAQCFSAEERALIDSHIPSSWILSADTLHMALTCQAKLVLKPGLGLCGRKIVFGRQMSPQDWRGHLQTLLERHESYVLQEVIDDIWSYTLPQWHGARRMICLGSLILEGQYAGSMLREDQFEGRAVIVNYAQGARWCAGIERTA